MPKRTKTSHSHSSLDSVMPSFSISLSLRWKKSWKFIPLCLLYLCSTDAKVLHCHSLGEHWGEDSPVPASTSPREKWTMFIGINDIYRPLQFTNKICISDFLH